MKTETWDAWLPRIVRAISAFLGLGIMVFETIADKSDRPWLYAAAITLIGLPAAEAAERLIGKVTGAGNAPIPPPPATVLPPIPSAASPPEKP